MTRLAKLCSLGYGGNSMEYGNGCSGSWYLHSPEDIAKHYSRELAEGCPLIDKRPALDINTAFAFASPMVNVDMVAGETDRFASRYLADSGAALMVGALKESGYGSIIRAAEIADQVAPELPGPLDYVPIDYYLDWWRARGARIYRFTGGQFIEEAAQ